jgi:hypothetical protein
MPRVLPLSLLIICWLALAFAPLPASAKPHITSYAPPVVVPGGTVTIRGTGLDRERIHNPNLRWGQGGTTLGSIIGGVGGSSPIRSWMDDRISLTLPESIDPGRYWIAIFSGSKRVSNKLETLGVSGGEGACVGAGCPEPAPTDPVITSFNPPHTFPGGEVRLSGLRFGTTAQQVWLSRIAGPTPQVVQLEILNWNNTTINVRLPTTTPTGAWHIGIYRTVEEPLGPGKDGLRAGLEGMHSRAVQVGTTKVSFFQTGQNNFLFSDPCMEGPPPPTAPIPLHPAGWDNSRVAVGHVAQKRSGGWDECWKWNKVSYQGAVQFDLRAVVEASHWLPRDVELLFDVDNSGGFEWETLGHSPLIPCPRIWIFEASEEWHPGLFHVANHPRGTVIGAPGHGEVHFKVPVTENVRRLIEAAQGLSTGGVSTQPSRHLGFLLNAEKLDEWHDDPNPKQCLGRYRNFVLEVKW